MELQLKNWNNISTVVVQSIVLQFCATNMTANQKDLLMLNFVTRILFKQLWHWMNLCFEEGKSK